MYGLKKVQGIKSGVSGSYSLEHVNKQFQSIFSLKIFLKILSKMIHFCISMFLPFGLNTALLLGPPVVYADWPISLGTPIRFSGILSIVIQTVTLV